MNDLDLLGMLQSWSFRRFLPFSDPEGSRRFPRALAAAFGKERAELGRLWRVHARDPVMSG